VLQKVNKKIDIVSVCICCFPTPATGNASLKRTSSKNVVFWEMGLSYWFLPFTEIYENAWQKCEYWKWLWIAASKLTKYTRSFWFWI